MAKTHTFQQKPNKQGIATTTNKQPNTLNHTTTPNILPTTTKPKYPCDAELISAMVYSAKHGKWDIVWEILDTKPHLINCIPSDRAWSVLHQAVWKNDVITVHKLLSYPACDPEIKTKLDKTNDSGIGKKPIDLAKCENIKAMLRKAASKKCYQKINNDAPTMLPCNKWENYLGECNTDVFVILLPGCFGKPKRFVSINPRISVLYEVNSIRIVIRLFVCR